MNFFEQQLRKIDIGIEPTFVGRACYFAHNGLVTKVYFDTSGISGRYDCLRMETKSRDAIINKQVIHLRDLLGEVKGVNFPTPLFPHIWQYNNSFEWYAYSPTSKGWDTISSAIKSYIDIWHGI